MQNWYKNVFVDATVPYKHPYMQIWTALSNRDYTGFEPELLASKVCLRTLWAPKQTYQNWKFKSISFQIYKHINIVL